MLHDQLTTTTQGIQHESFLMMYLKNQKNWVITDDELKTMLAETYGVIQDIFAGFEPVPFSLIEDDLVNLTSGQFTKRLERLKRYIEITTIDLEMMILDDGI